MAEKANATTVAKPVDWNRKVSIRLFKDSEKYSDDVVVGVNGKQYVIKRGVTVQIPYKVFRVLENSMRQDAKTAEMLRGLQETYEAESRKYGL